MDDPRNTPAEEPAADAPRVHIMADDDQTIGLAFQIVPGMGLVVKGLERRRDSGDGDGESVTQVPPRFG